MGRLEDKVVIITGGAQGMGASHSRRFVKEGAKIVIADVNEEKGEALSQELGESASFYKLDVSKGKEWEQLIQFTEKNYGPVTILVNNAGVSLHSPIEELGEEAYQNIININQIGVFLGMKHVIPSMKKAEKGSIINISSLAGLVGAATNIAYDSTKFAVRGMTKSAAAELGPFGIRANSVHPGITKTEFISGGDESSTADRLLENTPLKRLADPEEITGLVLFLASDESSFSTGAEFVADGGISATY